MKSIIKTLTLLLSITLVLISSCSDDIMTATITSVSPDEAYPRNLITISGGNLEHVQYVFLGTTGVSFEFNNGNIVFEVPQNMVDGDFDITLALIGNVRVKSKMKVLPSADPIFTSFSKRAAREGESVTIQGGSLNGVQSVTIGGIEAEVTANSSNSVTFTVPSGVENKRGMVKVVTEAGERETEFIFYVGKETLITNFDGSSLAEWGNIGGAVDVDLSGIRSSNPNPIDGNFFKMVGSQGGWGGSQIEVPIGFGLTASRDNTILVVDVNTNGTSPNWRFNVAITGDAKFWSSYQGSTNGWETLEVPLSDFGWEYNGEGTSQNVDGQAIVPSELAIVKIQWGSPVIEGGEVNFDNVRFIEF